MPHRAVRVRLRTAGVHPGDELVGLAAALLSLGTRGLVATVAPVADRTSKPFMLRLHRYLDAGISLSTALNHAQCDVALRCFPRRPDRRCRVDDMSGRHSMAVYFLNLVFRHFCAPKRPIEGLVIRVLVSHHLAGRRGGQSVGRYWHRETVVPVRRLLVVGLAWNRRPKVRMSGHARPNTLPQQKFPAAFTLAGL